MYDSQNQVEQNTQEFFNSVTWLLSRTSQKERTCHVWNDSGFAFRRSIPRTKQEFVPKRWLWHINHTTESQLVSNSNIGKEFFRFNACTIFAALAKPVADIVRALMSFFCIWDISKLFFPATGRVQCPPLKNSTIVYNITKDNEARIGLFELHPSLYCPYIHGDTLSLKHDRFQSAFSQHEGIRPCCK